MQKGARKQSTQSTLYNDFRHSLYMHMCNIHPSFKHPIHYRNTNCIIPYNFPPVTFMGNCSVTELMSRVNPCYWLYHYFQSECNKSTMVPHQLLLSIIRSINTTQYVTMPLHCYCLPIIACNNGLLCRIYPSSSHLLSTNPDVGQYHTKCRSIVAIMSVGFIKMIVYNFSPRAGQCQSIWLSISVRLQSNLRPYVGQSRQKCMSIWEII